MVAGYTLRARLGSGGMGMVYLSFTPGGRAIAIKLVRPEFADDTEFRRRFKQEVSAARRVQGIFTAPVIDADPDAAQPWLATAYIPGPALSHAVAEHGPLRLPAVFRLLAGVAEGVQAVHAAGLVHRDLKPSNVLLAADGPRVIDFGIVYAVGATSLTSTGATIGTPSFMAPEQVTGGPVSAATDVFALAHLAVYAATGHPVFGEGQESAIAYRIVNRDPDLEACPEPLCAIARRCLSKHPAERLGLTEIIGYARAENAGKTAELANSSWLPPDVSDTLPSYEARNVPPTGTVDRAGRIPAKHASPTTHAAPGRSRRLLPLLSGVVVVGALLAIGVPKLFPSGGSGATSPGASRTHTGAEASSAMNWGKPVFTDNFNGSKINTSTWYVYAGSTATPPTPRRTTGSVVVHDGLLELVGHIEKPYGSVSGGVETKLLQSYGRFEVRFRTQAGEGYAPDIGLFPADAYPDQRQIGIVMVGQDRSDASQLVQLNGRHAANSITANFTAWHVVALDWRPGSLTFWLDGKKLWSVTAKNLIPSTPFHLAIQNDEGCDGACKPSTSAKPVIMYIGWVKIYRLP
jgi:serine/threonine protein kinase